MSRLIDTWFRIPFWQRVAGGFVLGALAGWLLGPTATTWFAPLGTLYVTLIKMIATPLVFFAVVDELSGAGAGRPEAPAVPPPDPSCRTQGHGSSPRRARSCRPRRPPH
jgi:hypothetical protein